jgi:hypothetical protein
MHWMTTERGEDEDFRSPLTSFPSSGLMNHGME